MRKIHNVRIDATHAEVDGVALRLATGGAEIPKEIYRTEVCDYQKFYKMDLLCRLGFVASELLLKAEGGERFVDCRDRAVFIYGEHATTYSDKEYQKSISDMSAFYPSPSQFVYTLPNIVTGEIALRNKYHGETSYIVCDSQEMMERHIETVFSTSPQIQSAVYGWLDVRGDNDFEVNMYLVIR